MKNIVSVMLAACLFFGCDSTAEETRTEDTLSSCGRREYVCREDCEPAACPVNGVICDAQVMLSPELECQEMGDACGGVRWCCAH